MTAFGLIPGMPVILIVLGLVLTVLLPEKTKFRIPLELSSVVQVKLPVIPVEVTPVQGAVKSKEFILLYSKTIRAPFCSEC